MKLVHCVSQKISFLINTVFVDINQRGTNYEESTKCNEMKCIQQMLAEPIMILRYKAKYINKRIYLM